MLVRTETEWERLARRSARGAIRPGNPVSGFGMHVGSRTFFAPMLLGTDLALLASSMCLLLPDFLARSEANEDAARFEGIGDRALTFDGRGVESLGDLAREVEGELGALTAPVRRGRVGLGRFRDQPRITGRVLLVVPENTPARIPALLVVDRGAGAGVQDGLLWEIRGAGGSWKAHARVVAIYADTTTLAVVFDKGGKPKEVGDVATTFIQREELGVTA